MNRRIKNKKIKQKYQAIFAQTQMPFSEIFSKYRLKNIRKLREKISILSTIDRVALFIKNGHSTKGLPFSYKNMKVV